MSRGWGLLALLAIVGACGESEAEREARAMREAVPVRLAADGAVRLTPRDRVALDLEVVTATEGAVPNVSQRFGQVRARPQDEALVVAPSVGRVAQPVTLAPGAEVQAGDVIAVMNPVLAVNDRVALGVQRAQVAGQLQAAQQELTTRLAEAARVRELAGVTMSAERVQQADLAVATTRAQIAALRQSLGVQSGVGTLTPLRAPVSGTVVEVSAFLGAVMQPGERIARVLGRGPRWIDLPVAPDEPTGAHYEVASGDRWVPATLAARGVVIGEDGTRRDRLEVAASEFDGLLPGAVVTVRVVRGGDVRGVVLPESAVIPGAGLDLVYVERPDGSFVARPVRVAARFGGRVRLASGLSAGERVVTRGAMALRGESLRGSLRHEE